MQATELTVIRLASQCLFCAAVLLYELAGYIIVTSLGFNQHIH